MAGTKDEKSLPNSKEVEESLCDPAALAVLGNSAVNYVLANPYKYESKWFERLWTAVGNLKDAIESNLRINSAVVELALLLLHPEKVARPLSRAEIADIVEPTEEEVEAWAWGHDLAKTSKWFVALALLGILALLAFAVVTFGLESPGSTTTIIFLSLGSVFLAGATAILGIGLYQLYVVRGYLSWEYRGYPNAEVNRRTKFYKTSGWYAYSLGGVFIGLSIAFVIIIAQRLLEADIPDYSYIRLAFLASTALGLILFALGVWPIVRSVVATAEIDRRMGRVKYLASPRLLVAFLPILTGTLSLVISWLFR